MGLKSVRVYSFGSCDPETRLGYYEVVMEYGEHRKYFTGSEQDTTANRCIILGLMAAVERLKEPCAVAFITATKIGLNGLGKNKGPNVDLLKALISLLSHRNCEFEFKEQALDGDTLKAFIRRHQ